MKNYNDENVVGAFALSLSDALLKATQLKSPKSISAAGLTLIGHVPDITIYELSFGLGLSHPGTVRLVDRMAADGLVTRKRSTTDGRAITLSLTDAGKTVEERILLSRREVLHDALSSLSSTELETFSTISAKLIAEMLTDEETALKICRLCDIDQCNNCPVDDELLRQESI